MKQNLSLVDLSMILLLFGFLGWDSICTANKVTWAFICTIGIFGAIASLVLNLLECIINRRKKVNK